MSGERRTPGQAGSSEKVVGQQEVRMRRMMG